MAKINMCFEHQVAVKAFFVKSDNTKKPSIIKYFKSNTDGTLEIPLDGMDKGNWKIMLEWNHEGKDFALVKHVKIPYTESTTV